jgi:hypothetical protein
MLRFGDKEGRVSARTGSELPGGKGVAIARLTIVTIAKLFRPKLLRLKLLKRITRSRISIDGVCVRGDKCEDRQL